MSRDGDSYQPAPEVEVAPPARALGWIALLCGTPFLLVVVPSIIHHDPFVLAHADRYRVDNGNGRYPAGVLETISLALNLIWLLITYVGISAIVTRQYFGPAGARYRQLGPSRHLPLDAMTSIELTTYFRPRGTGVLERRTGIELGSITDAPHLPGFQPLAIRGTVGKFWLTKLTVRLQLQSGKGALEAMQYVDRWVAVRPELVRGNTRTYFIERSVLPREPEAAG